MKLFVTVAFVIIVYKFMIFMLQDERSELEYVLIIVGGFCVVYVLFSYVTKLFLYDMKRENKSSINDQWKGYQAENLLDIIYEKQWSEMNDSDWMHIVCKVLFILEPYYNQVLLINDIGDNNAVMVPMLSVRQMYIFRNALHVIKNGDVYSAIREWSDFIHDYGKYKNHRLTQLETYIIYVLALEIVSMFSKKGIAVDDLYYERLGNW